MTMELNMDKIRILLADDDGIIRTGMEMILETQADFEVVAVCQSGEEACRACGTESPDVVVLDIRMPGMSGIEAAKTILAHQDVKILLLTTFDEPELITAAMQAAVSRKLGKHSLFRMALCEIISLLF